MVHFLYSRPSRFNRLQDLPVMVYLSECSGEGGGGRERGESLSRPKSAKDM